MRTAVLGLCLEAAVLESCSPSEAPACSGAPSFTRCSGKCREGGAVKPVSPLQAGRAGLLHGNGWVNG